MPVSVWNKNYTTALLFASVSAQAEYDEFLDDWQNDLLAEDAQADEAEYQKSLGVAIKVLHGHAPSKFKGRIRQPLKAIAFMWLLAMIALPVGYLALFNNTMGAWNKHHNVTPLPAVPTGANFTQGGNPDVMNLNKSTPTQIPLTFSPPTSETKTPTPTPTKMKTSPSPPPHPPIPQFTPARIG